MLFFYEIRNNKKNKYFENKICKFVNFDNHKLFFKRKNNIKSERKFN